MKRYLLALWLVVAWVAMWGRLSVANVASGVLVALGLLALLPPGGSQPHYVFRPVAIVRFVAYFLRQLVVATAALTREIVTPRDRIRTGVIAVPMEEGISDGLLVFLANATASFEPKARMARCSMRRTSSRTASTSCRCSTWT